jgi:asparagine synthetase B (glutamine-hydrolysing)
VRKPASGSSSIQAPHADTSTSIALAVQFVSCRLPPSLRLRGLTSKYILKRAMRGLLPETIIHRKKQGFGVPLARGAATGARP